MAKEETERAAPISLRDPMAKEETVRATPISLRAAPPGYLDAISLLPCAKLDKNLYPGTDVPSRYDKSFFLPLLDVSDPLRYEVEFLIKPPIQYGHHTIIRRNPDFAKPGSEQHKSTCDKQDVPPSGFTNRPPVEVRSPGKDVPPSGFTNSPPVEVHSQGKDVPPSGFTNSPPVEVHSPGKILYPAPTPDEGDEQSRKSASQQSRRPPPPPPPPTSTAQTGICGKKGIGIASKNL